MEKDNKPKTAAFNAAMKGTDRIDVILRECTYYSAMAEISRYDLTYLILWKSKVFALFRELRNKRLTVDEKKIFGSRIKKIRKLKHLIVKVTNEEGSIIIVDQKKYQSALHMIGELEVDVRRSLDDRGLLIPDKPADLDGAML